MTTEVRDIASFENSQAIFAHYAAVKKRLRPQTRVNLLSAPATPANHMQVRYPRRRRESGLTAEQVYQNCQNWRKVFAERKGVSIELFSTRAVPLEGIFIQAEFFQHCIYQLGAEFKQLANLTGVSGAIVKSICNEFDEFVSRGHSNDCERSIELNKNDSDPLMCLAVEVAEKYQATIEDIRGKSQANYKLMARQEFMFRATHETKKARFAIAEFVHKDHKSVVSGLNSHNSRLEAYAKLKIGA